MTYKNRCKAKGSNGKRCGNKIRDDVYCYHHKYLGKTFKKRSKSMNDISELNVTAVATQTIETQTMETKTKTKTYFILLFFQLFLLTMYCYKLGVKLR